MLHYITSHMLHQCPALFVFKISSLWLKKYLLLIYLLLSLCEREGFHHLYPKKDIKVAGSKLAAQLL